jgi:hypothetical protein
MSEVHTETTQYDVQLPKPRAPKILLSVVVAVLVVAVVAFTAAAIINRAAQGQDEATARVMPADTMMYFSLNTHTDKLPNFNVIADAWKDSKEAKQLTAALELALNQANLSWEEDIAPWLGDRAAFGLIDLGGSDANNAAAPYRSPAVVLAVQTRDRAASDKFLANLRSTLEKDLKPNGYYTATLGDDTYRGIPLVYMTTESAASWSDPSQTRTQENMALATVNDVIVLTLNRTNLQKVIDAALDGKNLTTSENYKTVMNTLPDQNAGAMYMDYSRFMPAYFDMLLGVQASVSDVYSNIYGSVTCRNDQGTPDAQCLQQQQDEANRKREEARRQREAQLQQMRDMMQAIGGTGVVMSYEPTGIRFDMVAQQDVSKLPETLRKFYEAQQTPTANRIFSSLPADTIMAGNVGLNSQVWDLVFDPEYLKLMLSGLPTAQRDQVLTQLDQFQKLIGVDLKTDFFQLFNGEAAFAMLPQAEQQRSETGYSLPFQFAALADATDASKAVGSLDKIVQGVSALTQNKVKWQSLSGLPYSVILDSDGKPMLTYGVVDGRLVIGTNSNTLLAIANADQASLANNDTFKQATGLLPGNRLGTFFMDFQPLWKMAPTLGLSVSDCSACNYLQKFKWMSAGTEVPANGLSRGSLHLGVGQ